MSKLSDSMYDYRYDRKRAQIVDKCVECGTSIYEGEEYYDINGLILCGECLLVFKKLAGED